MREGWGRGEHPRAWKPRGATDLSPRARSKLRLLMLGTFQYAFFRTAAVFLGLVLFADGNYNPADVSAAAWGRAG